MTVCGCNVLQFSHTCKETKSNISRIYALYPHTHPLLIHTLSHSRPPSQNRLKVRVIASRAYHSLFVHNMLIRPTEEELRFFGTPDFTIYNAGAFKANRCVWGWGFGMGGVG